LEAHDNTSKGNGNLVRRESGDTRVCFMDRIFLSVICSGVMLLVTAFSLATPSIKYADPPPERTPLVRLMER
jgi:hypothetical protein